MLKIEHKMLKNGHKMPKDRHEIPKINMSRSNPKTSHLTSLPVFRILIYKSFIYLYLIVYSLDDIPQVLTTQACLKNIVYYTDQVQR